MDLNQVIAKLSKRRFLAERFNTNDALKTAVLDIIGTKSVGISGSASAIELGLYNELIKRGNTVYSHTQAEDKAAARRNAMGAEVYICSANAITESGQLLNIDGTGNRVAATVFGPQTVIVIAGSNKIAKDIESGIERTRRETCPKNARRIGLKTPCAATGECGDCQSKDRMCNAFMILEYPTRNAEKFYVFISDEPLGW